MRNTLIFFFCLVNFSYSQQYGWYVVSRPPGGWVDAIEFVDSLNGWIWTYNGLLRTTDGGMTWTESQTSVPTT